MMKVINTKCIPTHRAETIRRTVTTGSEIRSRNNLQVKLTTCKKIVLIIMSRENFDNGFSHYFKNIAHPLDGKYHKGCTFAIRSANCIAVAPKCNDDQTFELFARQMLQRYRPSYTTTCGVCIDTKDVCQFKPECYMITSYIAPQIIGEDSKPVVDSKNNEPYYFAHAHTKGDFLTCYQHYLPIVDEHNNCATICITKPLGSTVSVKNDVNASRADIVDDETYIVYNATRWYNQPLLHHQKTRALAAIKCSTGVIFTKPEQQRALQTSFAALYAYLSFCF